MVGMVMGNQDMMHLLEVHAIFLAVFAQAPQAYANIYDESIGFSGQPIAISTAATTERYEFQHLFFKISAKVIKSKYFLRIFAEIFKIFNDYETAFTFHGGYSDGWM
jgi:hypothetical protein